MAEGGKGEDGEEGEGEGEEGREIEECNKCGAEGEREERERESSTFTHVLIRLSISDLSLNLFHSLLFLQTLKGYCVSIRGATPNSSYIECPNVKVHEVVSASVSSLSLSLSYSFSLS